MIFDLMWFFFKTGLFSFGGGYGMISLVQDEVLSRGWMTAEEYLNFVAISESTPGPLAVKLAACIGLELAGFWGSVLSALCVLMPSFIIIVAIAKVYNKVWNNKYVAGCMYGLKPVVVGLVASALVPMAQAVFFPDGIITFAIASEIITVTFSYGVLATPMFWISAVILAFDFFLAMKKMHPILVIGISAAIGIGVGYADKLLF